MRSYAVRPERETCARVGTSAACMHVVEEEREYFAVCEYFRFDIWIKENGENEWGKKKCYVQSFYFGSLSYVKRALFYAMYDRDGIISIISVELFSRWKLSRLKI